MLPGFYSGLAYLTPPSLLFTLPFMLLLILLIFIVLIYVAILIRPVVRARRRRNKRADILDSGMLSDAAKKKGPDKK